MPRYRRSLAELAAPVACIDCGQSTPTPRRSRCTRCYTRLRRSGELGEGGACIDCGIEELVVLVGTREGPRCRNCRALAEHRLLTA